MILKKKCALLLKKILNLDHPGVLFFLIYLDPKIILAVFFILKLVKYILDDELDHYPL